LVASLRRTLPNAGCWRSVYEDRRAILANTTTSNIASQENGRSEAGQNCHFLLSQGQVGQVLSCITEAVGVKGGFLGWGFAVQKFRQAEW